jgi:hypothetical protein
VQAERQEKRLSVVMDLTASKFDRPDRPAPMLSFTLQTISPRDLNPVKECVVVIMQNAWRLQTAKDRRDIQEMGTGQDTGLIR